MTPNRIARAVKLLREEHGWSQSDLARRLDVTEGNVSKLERGQFSIKISTLARIAKPFGMEAWELLRFSERLQETLDSRHEDEPRLRTKNWRAA